MGRLALLAAVLPAPAWAQEALLPEMSVTATAEPLDARREASAAKIVLGREDIEALDAASIGELLPKLPGIGPMPDMEGRRGRGKGPDKLMPLILVDGEPLPGGARNPATALRMSPDMVERIEIIRNGGAEYPGAGPGGIVNLVLRDVPPRPTFNLRGGLGAQSGEAVARFDGQYGRRDGEFGWLLSGSAHRRPLAGRRETEVQRHAAGTRTDWRIETADEAGREHGALFAPRFNWRLPEGAQLILSPFLATNEERRAMQARRFAYADPLAGAGLAADGSAAERESGVRDSARLTAEWRAAGRAARPWSEWSLRLLLQGENETKRKDRREFDAAGAAAGTREERESRQEREAGLVFKGKRPVGDEHLLGLGAEWRIKSGDDRRQRSENGLPQPAGADAQTRQHDRRLVLWMQDEWQLAEEHLITPGLRLQAQESRAIDGLGATLERRIRTADPSLHWLWQPDPAWNLRAGLVRQQRAPGLKDLSGVVRAASGANSSGNPDKAGNPALAPETSRNLEIGVEHFLPDRAGSFGLTLFRREATNHIQKLVRLEGARWVERPWNVGTATLTGATLDLKARLDAWGLPQTTLRGNYARVHTHIAQSAAGLGASEGPRASLNLGFEHEIAARRLTFGGNLNLTSAIDRESSASVRQRQGARRQFDLYVRQKLDNHFALRLSVANLGHPDRLGEVEEYDASGALVRRERDRETSATLAMLTLEGRW